jgi:hypothetical protein
MTVGCALRGVWGRDATIYDPAVTTFADLAARSGGP